MGVAKKLPPGQHPLIYQMENIRIRHRWTLTNLGHVSGYPESTVSGWRRDGYSPSIAAFDAVLNTMGYRLKIERIPYEERKHEDIGLAHPANGGVGDAATPQLLEGR